MNEREINVWLRAQRATLDTRGMESFSIAIHDDVDGYAGAHAYDSTSAFHCTRGDTIAEAFVKLRAKITTDASTALRSEAARLLAKAEKLEAEVKP